MFFKTASLLMEWRIVVFSKQRLICLQKSSYCVLLVPRGCHKASSQCSYFLFFVRLLFIFLRCLLSGGQPQSNTTVSGSVGTQSADEPKVAHLCSVLPRPNTQQPY